MQRLSKIWLVLTGFKKIRETFYLYIAFTLINKILGDIFENKTIIIVLFIYCFFQLIKTFLYWSNYKYQIDQESIYLFYGYLTKHTSNIPLKQIKEVNEFQPLLYKPFNLYSLILYTESNTYGGRIELPLLNIEQISNIYFHVDKSVNKTMRKQYDYIINQKYLFLGSLSILNLLFFYLVLDSFSEKLNNYIHIKIDINKFLDITNSNYLLFSMFLCIYICLGIIFNYVKNFLIYGNHKIQITDTIINIEKGLLKQTKESIDKDRIQAIVIKTTFIQKIFNIYKIEIISNKENMSSEKEISNVLAPFIHRNDLAKLVKKVFPSFNNTYNLKKVPKKAIFLKLFRVILILLPLYFLMVIFFPVLLKFYFLIVTVLILGQILSSLFTEYSLNTEFTILKKANVVTNFYIIPSENLEEYSYNKNFLQNLVNLANFKLVMRKPANKHVVIKDIYFHDIYKFHEKQMQKYKQKHKKSI